MVKGRGPVPDPDPTGTAPGPADASDRAAPDGRALQLIQLFFTLYFIHILRRLHSYAAYDDTDYSIRVTGYSAIQSPSAAPAGQADRSHLRYACKYFKHQSSITPCVGPRALCTKLDRVSNGHSPIATATPAPFSIRTSLNLQMALTGSTNSVTHVREMVNAPVAIRPAAIIL